MSGGKKMPEASGGGRGTPEAGHPSTRFKPKRKPHNVAPAADYASLEQLVRKVGSQRRAVLLKGERTEITRAERTFRLIIERALEGKVRDLAIVLGWMLKYPALSKSYKEKRVILIHGAAARL